MRIFLLLLCSLLSVFLHGQKDFFLGADLSYVNEMEDCGVTYYEDGKAKDPYTIFADHDCQVVRLRLWHTPAWYDTLNSGQRYSDMADVRKSIKRSKAQDMKVLLDFHLSDRWADPGSQIIPAAWAAQANNLPVLKDSVYQYVFRTLMALYNDDLLPEMVQIGNETNKGILQTKADNDSGWKLDWPRNAVLFNAGIQAVRDAERASGQTIKIVLHAAGPDNAEWLFPQFIQNGVTDFDIMGISYYWAWHQPTDIEQAGLIIQNLRRNYPDYEVIIAETGYIWTTASNDAANNIISSVHPDYAPASPQNQRDWLIDLSKEVKKSGGLGVLYWEPAWVSSSCYTPWGQGSHQEHATFFDFSNNLLEEGGIQWLSYDYEAITSVKNQAGEPFAKIYPLSGWDSLFIGLEDAGLQFPVQLKIVNMNGQVLKTERLQQAETSLPLNLSRGIYQVVLYQHQQILAQRKIYWFGKK